MAVSNGIDWYQLYEPIAAMGFWCDLGFITFIVFMLFVLLNIISGIFIERAFKVISNDRDFWILEEAAEKDKYENRVMGLFYEMDKDCSGEVSWGEFQEALSNPHMEAYLSFLGLDTAH